MQHFRDKKKKQLKLTVSRPFWIFFCEIYHELSLCESLHFVLYAWSSYFALILCCVNITKLLNSKWPLDSHFKTVCSQKVMRSLTDIAVHICQIKRKSAGNFFLKCATSISLLVARVIEWLIIWV